MHFVSRWVREGRTSPWDVVLPPVFNFREKVRLYIPRMQKEGHEDPDFLTLEITRLAHEGTAFTHIDMGVPIAEAGLIEMGLFLAAGWALGLTRRDRGATPLNLAMRNQIDRFRDAVRVKDDQVAGQQRTLLRAYTAGLCRWPAE